MKSLCEHISQVKTLHSLNEFITEKLLINKNFKNPNDDINDLIDVESEHLYWNYNIGGGPMKISNMLFTIKFSSSSIVKIDHRYVEQCLNELRMYDKTCKGMYIPQLDYTYLKDIDNDMLEKYDKKPLVMDGLKYDIYYAITDKYFILRIVTTSKKITMDFIPEL